MRKIFTILLLLALTFGEFVSLQSAHIDWWSTDLVQIAQSVANGHAYTYIFQSRLLGPCICNALVHCGMTWPDAVHWFYFAALLITNATVLRLTDVNTALAYLVYFRLVQLSGATFAALNNYIVPFIGLALGAFWLGEPVGLGSWLGLGLVIAGVMVTGWATGFSVVKA